MNTLVFVDLSSIAYPIWHVSQAEPDPNHTSQQIVARVRTLTAQYPHAAICCDSGKSFRNELSPTYKANRAASEAPLQHQITLAKEQLAAEGFPVWSVRGFEADDVIASGVARAIELEDVTALVVTGDKDLLQLVGPRVTAMSVRDGSMLDEAAVVAKFGIKPDQMRDYLCLVGDASDNVKGAKGIGPTRAAELLHFNGSIDGVYERLNACVSDFKPSIASALREFRPVLDVTRSLITLRTDVDLPFDEIMVDRVAKQADASAAAFDMEDDMDVLEPTVDIPPVVAEAQEPSAPSAVAVREPDAIIAAPAEWERGLDPRSMKDARQLASDMFQSRMFSAYGSPQAVLSTVMVGRELGLPAMASLRSVHVIEGRHALAASLMVALVLKSGLAEYFEPVSFSETSATFETKRKGARNPVTLTHTLEMAQTAGLVKEKSGWVKNPTDMLVARASARLARMVYPDLLAGLYTPEELTEIKEQVAA